jgi:hypothetical protein
VQQAMRHVKALRLSKAVLVFAIALFYTILVLNKSFIDGLNRPANRKRKRAETNPILQY